MIVLSGSQWFWHRAVVPALPMQHPEGMRALMSAAVCVCALCLDSLEDAQARQSVWQLILDRIIERWQSSGNSQANGHQVHILFYGAALAEESRALLGLKISCFVCQQCDFSPSETVSDHPTQAQLKS